MNYKAEHLISITTLGLIVEYLAIGKIYHRHGNSVKHVGGLVQDCGDSIAIY